MVCDSQTKTTITEQIPPLRCLRAESSLELREINKSGRDLSCLHVVSWRVMICVMWWSPMDPRASFFWSSIYQLHKATIDCFEELKQSSASNSSSVAQKSECVEDRHLINERQLNQLQASLRVWCQRRRARLTSGRRCGRRRERQREKRCWGQRLRRCGRHRRVRLHQKSLPKFMNGWTLSK